MARVEIPVSHGQLEGLLFRAEPSALRGAALVCHPHPLYGGTMQNPVTQRISEAFRLANVSALRFNFRGVGRSSGRYDGGEGELEDARAALAFLAEQTPGAPLYVAGYSFGAQVALRLAAEEQRLRRVLAVGLAVQLLDYGAARAVQQPKAFVQGGADELGPLDEVKRLADATPAPRRLFVVDGADHVASSHLGAMEAQLSRAVRWLLDEADAEN